MSYDISSQISKLKVSFENNMKEANPLRKMWCGKQVKQLDKLLKTISEIKEGKIEKKDAKKIAKEIKELGNIKDIGGTKETKEAVKSFKKELPRNILNNISKNMEKEGLVWKKTMTRSSIQSQETVELPRIPVDKGLPRISAEEFFSAEGLKEWRIFTSNLSSAQLNRLDELLKLHDSKLISSIFEQISKNANILQGISSESNKASNMLEKIEAAMPFTREEVMKMFPIDKTTKKRIISQTPQGEQSLKLLQSNKKLEQLPTAVQQQIRNVCEIAHVLKNRVAPLLSDQQRILHIGKNFSGLPATFELHRKEDGSIETLIKLKLLGTGSFKNVTLTWIFETGANKARSKARLEHPNFDLGSDEQIRRGQVAEYEEKMLKLVKGIPHVIQVDDIIYSRVGKKEHQIIYMDPAEGDLSKMMKKLNPAQKDKAALDFLEGMAGIHKRGIVHRDIKPENILLFADENSGEIEAKIIDFGLAKHAPPDSLEWREMQHENLGTRTYVSPEMLSIGMGNNPSITTKTDVWAGGCVLWELFTGNPPPWISNFEKNFDHSQLYEAIKKEDNLPEPPNKNSREWLAWKMLRPNQDDRYTFEEAVIELKKIIKLESENKSKDSSENVI